MLRRALSRGDDEELERLVVVGLGNPGERYARTRHNAGQMALALLVERSEARLKRHRSGCMAAEVRIAGNPVVLAQPLTFMNESGRSVAALVRWYRAAPERLVVLHDELDIPFGRVQLKVGGGVAGHNGLRSLASHLSTRDFGRVRIGISRPAGRRDAADWVLSDFSRAERVELQPILERAADAVERIAERGFEAAMNEFNARAR
jgi:PTH1 family peptidyl-tRNA hydrolase